MDLSGGRFSDGKGKKGISRRNFHEGDFLREREKGFFQNESSLRRFSGNGFRDSRMDATPTNVT